MVHNKIVGKIYFMGALALMMVMGQQVGAEREQYMARALAGRAGEPEGPQLLAAAKPAGKEELPAAAGTMTVDEAYSLFSMKETEDKAEKEKNNKLLELAQTKLATATAKKDSQGETTAKEEVTAAYKLISEADSKKKAKYDELLAKANGNEAEEQKLNTAYSLIMGFSSASEHLGPKDYLQPAWTSWAKKYHEWLEQWKEKVAAHFKELEAKVEIPEGAKAPLLSEEEVKALESLMKDSMAKVKKYEKLEDSLGINVSAGTVGRARQELEKLKKETETVQKQVLEGATASEARIKKAIAKIAEVNAGAAEENKKLQEASEATIKG